MCLIGRQIQIIELGLRIGRATAACIKAPNESKYVLASFSSTLYSAILPFTIFSRGKHKKRRDWANQLCNFWSVISSGEENFGERQRSRWSMAMARQQQGRSLSLWLFHGLDELSPFSGFLWSLFPVLSYAEYTTLRFFPLLSLGLKLSLCRSPLPQHSPFPGLCQLRWFQLCWTLSYSLLLRSRFLCGMNPLISWWGRNLDHPWPRWSIRHSSQQW